MSERSKEYKAGYQAGFVDGYFTDSEQIAPYVAILQDLIAELRGYADEGYIMGASTMRELCTRAEARLREVQGE